MPGVRSIVPNVRHPQCPAPQGSARVSPQHTCPLGMSSQWPRFHGDTEPFPISGMLSTALGWALPPLPFTHGKQARMGPTALGGRAPPFQPSGRGTVPMSPVCPAAAPARLQCLTLCSPRGDEGCLGHAEAPATAGLGGGIPAAWPGEGSGARSGSYWEHHGAQGLCPGSSWCHGASKVPVLTVSQGVGWAWPCCVPPSLPTAAPSPWHDTALYPALHLGAAYYHFPSLAIPGDKFFLRSF